MPGDDTIREAVELMRAQRDAYGWQRVADWLDPDLNHLAEDEHKAAVAAAFLEQETDL